MFMTLKFHAITIFSTSKSPGATLSTRFDGNAIYIYGAVSPDYGTLDITIDGNTTTTINCSASAFRPQTLLFYSNDFVSGGHSLNLQVPSNASAVPVDFDFMTITRWSDNNGCGNKFLFLFNTNNSLFHRLGKYVTFLPKEIKN